MRIQDLDGKKVCILGFGREGQATLRALEKHAPDCSITIADRAEVRCQCADVSVQTGQNYLKNINRFDVIIKSPGIPPSLPLAACRLKLTTATQIFFDSIKDTGAIVIGITGSKGKSTTTSLIYEILRHRAQVSSLKSQVFLVGNIGKPVLDYLDKAKEKTIFVMEMSSYQLMDLIASPHIAVIAAFFPEHLDYHGSVEAYLEAKKHIARFQKENDVIFYNEKFAECREIAQESRGKKISFSDADAPVNIEDTRLLGKHNLSNIAAAWRVAERLGIDKKSAVETIRKFPGLPHRLQSLGIHLGIEWIDDAISTTPESTIAAIDALGDRVSTIILGGQDRGNDFTKLAARIARSQIRNVILFPGSGPRIKTAIEAALLSPAPTPNPSPVRGRGKSEGGAGSGGARSIDIFNAPDMRTAVTLAKEHSEPDAICLLSTASPSYNMFRNFEEKGEKFREEMEKKE